MCVNNGASCTKAPPVPIEQGSIAGPARICWTVFPSRRGLLGTKQVILTPDFGILPHGRRHTKHTCMYVCMYVCMDGWMDGCMYVCM